jgi:DNA-binding MarR family transcriptional regulator
MRRTKKNVDRDSRETVDYGPLEQIFGYQLRRAYSYLYRTFIAEFRELQLAPGQYSALLLIGLNPGLSQVDLAEATGLDGSTIVPITDRFERLGWIRRTRRRYDRRLYALRITPLGEETLDKARPLIAARQRRLASILSPDERRNLIDVLSRISDGPKESSPPTAGASTPRSASGWRSP